MKIEDSTAYTAQCFRFGTEITSLDEVAGASLFATERPGVFMGGELCGGGPMEAIAQGVEVSKVIEVFLQSARTA